MSLLRTSFDRFATLRPAHQRDHGGAAALASHGPGLAPFERSPGASQTQVTLDAEPQHVRP